MLRCDFVRRNHSQLNCNDNSVKRDAGKCASVYFMTVSNRNFQSGQTVQNLHNPCTLYKCEISDMSLSILIVSSRTGILPVRYISGGSLGRWLQVRGNYLISMSCWFLWATTHLCALFYVSARSISGKTKPDRFSFKWLIGCVWTVIVCPTAHLCLDVLEMLLKEKVFFSLRRWSRRTALLSPDATVSVNNRS